MDGGQIVKLLVTGSILLLVFAMGARATFGDAFSLLRNLFRPPNTLMRALLAMYVVVPVVATLLSQLLDLSTPVRTALVAMAVAPIPPILPGKQIKGGGTHADVFGLLVAVSIASIVLVPVVVELIGLALHTEVSFSPAEVASLIAMTILIPLGVGIALNKLAPNAAAPIASWASRIGMVVLGVCVIAILYKVWPQITALADGPAMLAVFLLAAVAVGVGHLLGGPDADDRSNLAIATAVRHPGIALAVATHNVPEEASRMLAAVLLYFLVATVLTSLYVLWRKRQA